MRIFKTGLLLTLCAALAACGGSPTDNRIVEPVTVPDFTLKTPDGQSVTLSEFKQKSPALVLFWATWCPFCLKEIPQVNALRAKYSEDQLQIFAINEDASDTDVQRYIKEHEMNYAVLLDPGEEVAAAYGIVGVPTYVLIDRSGNGVAAEHALSRGFLERIDQAVRGR